MNAEATPMPTARDEEWRRTSIRALKLDQVLPFGAGAMPRDTLSALPRDVRAGLSEEGRAGLLVQHNSGMVFHMISEEATRQGVIFTGLDEAVREHPELVRKYFMSEAVTPNHDKFSALHGAFWSGGT